MVKIVYPDTNRPELKFNPQDYLPCVEWTKSMYPDGRIIANDNTLR